MSRLLHVVLRTFGVLLAAWERLRWPCRDRHLWEMP